jgi:hypothetical protein
MDREHALPIARIALVAPPVALEHSWIGAPVDLVRVQADRRPAARDECLPKARGCEREIGDDAEASEALAQDVQP